MTDSALRFPTVLGNRIHNTLRGLARELTIPNYAEVDEGKVKRIAIDFAGSGADDIAVSYTSRAIIVTSESRNSRIHFRAHEGQVFSEVQAGLKDGLLQIRATYAVPEQAIPVEIQDGHLEDWDVTSGPCGCSEADDAEPCCESESFSEKDLRSQKGAQEVQE